MILGDEKGTDYTTTKSESNIKSIRTLFGTTNNLEVYYVCAFLLSILLSAIFGFLDNSLYYLITIIQIPKSALYIFLHNFVVDLITVATGGILVLFSNFLTFTVISGLFAVRKYTLFGKVRVMAIVFGTWSTGDGRSSFYLSDRIHVLRTFNSKAEDLIA